MILAAVVCAPVARVIYWVARCQWLEARLLERSRELSAEQARRILTERALRGEITRLLAREKHLEAEFTRQRNRSAYR